MNPENQKDWSKIVHNSSFLAADVCVALNMKSSQLSKYLNCRNVPAKENFERIVAVMKVLLVHPKIQRHASFGYATEAQMEDLKSCGVGPYREALLAEIQSQTAREGKARGRIPLAA